MSTTTSPPSTPARGVRWVTVDVGQLVREVAAALPAQPESFAADFVPFDPPLTPGQKRVFEGERARLFRMLDARTPGGDLQPGKVAAVLELLDDMASQAPAVDQVIAAEQARRRETAQARPTLALALGRNRGRS